MPAAPVLQREAFDPELIETMAEAFTNACAELGIVDRADPMNELVARRIIELAQHGILSKEALYVLTLMGFKANPQ